MENNYGPLSQQPYFGPKNRNIMRFLLSLFLSTGLLYTACTGKDPAQTATNTTPLPETPIEQFDANDPRAGDSLLTVMGPLEGKVVADMFAGDGYYTWKLLSAGARVLALDDNPANIAALQARKKSEGIGDDQLLIRLTTPGVTGLLPNEVDLALITREYSTLGDRAAWFAQLMNNVKAPHTFFMVNYLPQQSPGGPPLSQRMDYNRVSDEVSGFGYDDVGVMYKKMPYRFILFGSVPPLTPEDE